MNRRQALIGAGAVALAAATPALAAPNLELDKGYKIDWVTYLVGGVVNRPDAHDILWSIHWKDKAADSVHAPLVRAWAMATIELGYLHCHGDGMICDRTVRLENVTFTVRPGKKVWNPHVGYTDEDGLEIVILEGDAEFAPIGIASTHGAGIKLRDEFVDAYYVRKPTLRYDEDRELRFALGDDREGYFSKTTKCGFDGGFFNVGPQIPIVSSRNAEKVLADCRDAAIARFRAERIHLV